MAEFSGVTIEGDDIHPAELGLQDYVVITLKARRDRKAVVSEIIDRLRHDVADIPGMTIYFQPVQDVQI